MKVSLKFQDQNQNQNQNSHKNQQQNPFLVRAKVPISVFGLPFLSGVAATDPSDPSLSLRTNFSSGPSLKLSYTPTSATATAGAAVPPFTVTLKSGVGLFGSAHNSPLIISANFTLSPQNPNPTFSLQFKPQFGDFSFSKTTYSSPNSESKSNGGVNSFTFVPLERPIWKEMKLESGNLAKSSILSGIAVRAKTIFPLTKGLAMNFRWGVNLPAEFGKQLPFLSVNKIKIQRVDEVKEVKEMKIKNSEGSLSDLEVLKGLCFWMGRELDILQKENGKIKHTLEEMKLGNSVRSYSDSFGKKPLPPAENSDGFEQWRSKKKSRGDDNVQKESKKSANRVSSVESELEKAIKAASVC